MQEAKTVIDTEKCSWRKLLREFEEEGHTDIGINGHAIKKKHGIAGEGGGPSFFCRTC